MKFTVFVSYSWKNELHRVALIDTLKSITDIDIKLDKVDIPYGGNIWDIISSMLDESDCVVTILTEESKTSFGVYQELVRAHDRGIEIIPICHSNIKNEELPSFIRPVNRIPYSSDATFIEAIQNLKRQIEILRDKKAQRNNPRKRIQSLLSAINNLESKHQPFRLRVLDQILGSLTREIKGLTENYTIDLSIESNFLLRARPLFNSAEKVFAVSIDYVSTFWLNAGLADVASQYIRDQSENTVRLFVFENPSSAHNYAEVLEAHSRKYGKIGAVLLCSLHSYRNFLRTVSSKPENLLQNDFAVLKFDGFSLAATLDNTKLHFHEIDAERIDSDIYLNHEVFVNIMSSLSQTPIAEFNSRHSDKFTILRWSDEFLSDRKQWAEKLKILFKADLGIQNKDLHHLVFLRKRVPDYTVSDIKNQLLEARNNSELNFVDVWLGKQMHLHVDDGVYHGSINTGPRSDLGSLIMFHFKNKDDLSKYYSSVKHSFIRRELYENFSEEIRDKFQSIDKAMENGHDVSLLYEEIERDASQFIERYDYMYSEKIDDVVKTSPYRFPYVHIN